MSLAYLDPGNLESDLQNGAYTGYTLLWTLFLCTLVGLIFQILAARLGAVSGKNLAEACRIGYPKNLSRIMWLMTEVAIIGSDVQEVVGTATAFNILFGWPLWAGTLLTGLDTFTFMAIHYFGKRILEVSIFLLILVMMGCFFTNFAFLPPSFHDLASGFAFQCPSYAVLELVATVGAVIMPHNIYLHSALVQSKAVDRANPTHLKQANKYNLADSVGALFISFLINAALVASFANGFFNEECAQMRGGPRACLPGSACSGASCVPCKAGNGLDGVCTEIGLNQGGDALQALLRNNGRMGEKMFAIGLLAAGQASTLTGAYAGQYVLEGFFELRMPIWLRTLVTRSIALGPAIAVALLTANNEALNSSVNQSLNVLQSVVLPFALIPILHFASDPDFMGNFALKKRLQGVCWILAVLVVIVNFYLVFSLLIGAAWWIWVLAVIFTIVYGVLISFLICERIKLYRRCRK